MIDKSIGPDDHDQYYILNRFLGFQLNQGNLFMVAYYDIYTSGCQIIFILSSIIFLYKCNSEMLLRLFARELTILKYSPKFLGGNGLALPNGEGRSYIINRNISTLHISNLSTARLTHRELITNYKNKKTSKKSIPLREPL